MIIPKHIAIIMDGNGRWAERRKLPRVSGHQQGVESIRTIVNACSQKNIEQLTLFAFSSENWLRPQGEVKFLLSLALKLFQKKEIQTLCKNNVKLKIIGDRSPFSLELKTAMLEAEGQTQHNTGLIVNIALNYGGQWDIVQAARKLCESVASGELKPNEITEKTFQEKMSLSVGSPPDLLIRSSGEQRISNFLLWDIAYSELYFTETLWPDFKETELDKAIEAFSSRQRRFGHNINLSENPSSNSDSAHGKKEMDLNLSNRAEHVEREEHEQHTEQKERIGSFASTESCISA
jgi:undecaprenyl diphosphate synthase